MIAADTFSFFRFLFDYFFFIVRLFFLSMIRRRHFSRHAD